MKASPDEMWLQGWLTEALLNIQGPIRNDARGHALVFATLCSKFSELLAEGVINDRPPFVLFTKDHTMSVLVDPDAYPGEYAAHMAMGWRPAVHYNYPAAEEHCRAWRSR